MHLREKPEISERTSPKNVAPIRNRRIAYKVDQGGPRVDHDRNRRALFNGIFRFPIAQIMIFGIIDGVMENVRIIIRTTENLSIRLNRVRRCLFWSTLVPLVGKSILKIIESDPKISYICYDVHLRNIKVNNIGNRKLRSLFEWIFFLLNLRILIAFLCDEFNDESVVSKF